MRAARNLLLRSAARSLPPSSGLAPAVSRVLCAPSCAFSLGQQTVVPSASLQGSLSAARAAQERTNSAPTDETLLLSRLSITDPGSPHFVYPVLRAELAAAGLTPPFPSPQGTPFPVPYPAASATASSTSSAAAAAAASPAAVGRAHEHLIVAIDRATQLLPRPMAIAAIGLLKQLHTQTATDLDIFYSFLTLAQAREKIPEPTFAAFISAARSSGRIGWAAYLFLNSHTLVATMPTSALNSVINSIADVAESPAIAASPRFFPEGFCGLSLAETATRALSLALFDHHSPLFHSIRDSIRALSDSGAVYSSPLRSLHSSAGSSQSLLLSALETASVSPDAHTVSAAIRLLSAAGAPDAAAELVEQCHSGRLAIDALPYHYNLVMTALDRAGLRARALKVYNLMSSRGVRPDGATLSTVLTILKKEGRIDALPGIVNAQLSQGNATVEAFNTMIAATLHATKDGTSKGDARARVADILRAMSQLGVPRDTVTVNTLIGMHLDARDPASALTVLAEADAEGVPRSQQTHVAAARAHALMGDVPAFLASLARVNVSLADARTLHRLLAAGAAASGNARRAALSAPSPAGAGEAWALVDAVSAATAETAGKGFGLPRSLQQLRAWAGASEGFYALSALAEAMFTLQQTLVRAVEKKGAASSSAAAAADKHAPTVVAFVMGLESKLQFFSAHATAAASGHKWQRESRLRAQVLLRAASLTRARAAYLAVRSAAQGGGAIAEAAAAVAAEEDAARGIVGAVEQWYPREVLEGVREYGGGGRKY